MAMSNEEIIRSIAEDEIPADYQMKVDDAAFFEKEQDRIIRENNAKGSKFLRDEEWNAEEVVDVTFSEILCGRSTPDFKRTMSRKSLDHVMDEWCNRNGGDLYWTEDEMRWMFLSTSACLGVFIK